jgi:hypothetical protein
MTKEQLLDMANGLEAGVKNGRVYSVKTAMIELLRMLANSMAVPADARRPYEPSKALTTKETK